MLSDPINLVITGAGGQGNVIAAHWLGEALLRGGLRVTVGDTYGLSQRGGSVMSHIRVSSDRRYGPLIPKGLAHVILGLEPVETLRVLADYGNPEVVTMTNDRPVYPLDVIAGEAEYPEPQQIREALDELSAKLYWVSATKIAQELGGAIVANIVMMGTLFGSGLVPVPQEIMLEVLRDHLHSDKWEANREAFSIGVGLANEQ